MRARCVPATRAAHDEWYADMVAARAAADALFRHVSGRWTGRMANIQSPLAYEQSLLHLESLGAGLSTNLVGMGRSWATAIANRMDHCVGTEEAAPEAQAPPAQELLHPGACPGPLKGLSFNIDLEFATLGATCEQLRLSTEGAVLPGLSGFGEVRFDPRAGTMIVVAGGKAGAKLGPVGAAFKSGAYVKLSTTGIEDVGWRVGPSTSISQGPFRFSGPSDEVDISFVGAFSG
jgi:hypothetical protein